MLKFLYGARKRPETPAFAHTAAMSICGEVKGVRTTGGADMTAIDDMILTQMAQLRVFLVCFGLLYCLNHSKRSIRK